MFLSYDQKAGSALSTSSFMFLTVLSPNPGFWEGGCRKASIVEQDAENATSSGKESLSFIGSIT